MRWTLIVLVLTGCDRFALGGKQKADSDYLEQRRTAIADVQANIDLAIAQADWQRISLSQLAIKGDQERIEKTNKAYDPKEASSNLQVLHADEDDLDKAIDIAARHRCNR